MRRTTATSAPLTALLLVVVLSGCSVDIVDPTQPSASSATASSPSEAGSPSDDAPSPDSSPDPSPDPEPSAGSRRSADAGLSAAGQAERARLSDAATTTMPCPTDPLTSDGAVIRVEGPCADLVIEIDAGVVIADDVGAVMLSGSGTVVYVREVDAITVTGSASSIFWEGATPTVDDRGSANTLKKG
ncbi:DUF3060 domain-containing protein [Microbacterium sp. ANT_H45B]|uniref:DUF3060 domain-containing protein n=1 Tax=Microbacterium sp. ANT_H45B TaxID=2597346 RepID=UPI0011EFC23D|nr:DUF3060 domain-containing protein [Microbacterium sp. ANT_H45B]KAA0959553.1 DUF3060 domain-containing protein [Microbacterium sp. ANT_H45B]